MDLFIITVSYNSDLFIKSCIESVLNQTYARINYIIIDGGSTDNTVEIIKDYDSKIYKWLSEPDKGIYDAMNKGINLSGDGVVGIINSDDLYVDNDVLNDVMQCFIQDPDLDIVYSDLEFVNRDDINKTLRRWTSMPFYNKFFEHGHVPPHPTLFLRKRVYDQAGLFNADYSLAADYELMLRIFKKFNFKSQYLNRVTIKMRLGGASTKNIKNLVRQNKEVLKSWKINELSVPRFLMFFRIINKLKQFLFKNS